MRLQSLGPNLIPAESQPTSPEQPPQVAVLMCTHNGAEFLPQQLDSLANQTHRFWSLYVSDDGSKDQTLLLLQSYADAWGNGKCTLFKGPQRGFVWNFLALTCNEDIQADYFAWSDQDDIWATKKLAVAIEWLQNIPSAVPALYCGRTQIICELGRQHGLSPLFHRPPSFQNALVQSIAGGNTMVFNQAARRLIMEAGPHVLVPSHDWWCYQLVSGVGGAIYYDHQPHVLYRQHQCNLIGSNNSWRARIRRVVMTLQGRFSQWNTQNIHALDSMGHRLGEEQRHTLALFKKARQQCLPARITSLYRARLYRQTLLGNLGFVFAALLNKV